MLQGSGYRGGARVGYDALGRLIKMTPKKVRGSAEPSLSRMALPEKRPSSSGRGEVLEPGGAKPVFGLALRLGETGHWLLAFVFHVDCALGAEHLQRLLAAWALSGDVSDVPAV